LRHELVRTRLASSVGEGGRRCAWRPVASEHDA